MPSSYSSSGRFTLQATGENNNTWGVILNTGVFQLVDTAIFGRLGFALSGTKVLTTALGATDEARNPFLDVTGGTGGTVTIPAVSKGYFVRNGAAGDVIVSAGGPASATFRAGDAGWCWTDGSSVYPARIAGLTLQDYVTAATLAVTGTLPAAVGNLGKALIVRNPGPGEIWTASQLSSADLSDNAALRGLMVALAVAL